MLKQLVATAVVFLAMFASFGNIVEDMNPWIVLLVAVWIVVLLYLFFSDYAAGSTRAPSGFRNFTPEPVGSEAGVSSIQGRRPHMEDTYKSVLAFDGKDTNAFYGVFDGHGGARASTYTAQHLFSLVQDEALFRDPEFALTRGHQRVDEDFLKLASQYSWEDGTTAVSAVIFNKTLYVANTGDSRSVLVSKGKAVPMSSDHKPNDALERKRIEAAGGRVLFMGTCWRVAGILAVARAIGDRHLKRWVIPDPDIKKRTLTKDDQYLILASDGLWDVTSNEEAAEIVMSVIKSTDGDVEAAAKSLTSHAFREGSLDNITSMVVDLKTYR